MSYGLVFSAPERKKLAAGVRIVQTAHPTQEFWSAWRRAKDSLKDLGYEVHKNADNLYVVTRVLTPEDEKPAPEVTGYAIKNTAHLYSYQIKNAGPICAAIHKFGSAIDASDTGTGKSYTNLAVCIEFGLRPGIVCLKTAREHWRRICKQFGVTPAFVANWEECKSKHFAHMTLTYAMKRMPAEIPLEFKGDVQYRETDLYQYMLKQIKERPISFRVTSRIVENGKTIYLCAYVYEKKVLDDIVWTVNKSGVMLIFDEVHRAKGKTLNAKMVIAAKKQNIRFIGLSATIGSSPMDLRALGYGLGLHKLTDFQEWIIGYGCFKNQFNSWECADSKDAMLKIHHELFPMHGGRVRIADLGDAFPETQITADVYEIEKADDQNKAYEKLLKEIDFLTLQKDRNAQAAILTLRLRYRQLTELLKVDLLTELALEHVENGLSVVVFCNFTETLNQLVTNLNAKAFIHGQQSSEERQWAIDAFQSDEERIIVANMAAGGASISLHDVRGEFPRCALIAPTDTEIGIKQVLGRVHRAGGKSKSLQRLIFAKGTVEEKVCANVAVKLAAMSTLNDGDLAEPDIFNLLRRPV